MIYDSPVQKMYHDYCIELDEYDGREYPPGQDLFTFRQYASNHNVTIKTIKQDGKEVGFIITLKPDYNPYEIIIAEAYIKPKNRRRGIMSKIVAEVVNGETFVRFMVFKANKGALAFWGKVMKANGFQLATQEQVDETLLEFYYVHK